jgi:IS1 family transposase
MNYNTLLLLCFFLILLELWHLFQQKWLKKLLSFKRSGSKTRKAQVMRPKTPKDCPQCCASLDAGSASRAPSPKTPIPWSEVKSKKGRKKKIRTQNYFCSNQKCDYYLVTDQKVHALVGDGTHGKYELIQDFLCQACQSKFTCRKHTVLYRIKTHPKIVCLSLTLLARGIDINALADALEIREVTLRTWLTRSGDHGRKLHDHFITALDLVHLQLDELWADVKHAGQDVWVWTVCDAKTKLIPVIQLGPRTQAMAYAVVHELIARLKAGCVPVFSSDGLKHYYYALTAHFGEWVHVDGQNKPVWMLLPDFLYAQVIKYRQALAHHQYRTTSHLGLLDDYRSRLERRRTFRQHQHRLRRTRQPHHPPRSAQEITNGLGTFTSLAVARRRRMAAMIECHSGCVHIRRPAQPAASGE